MNSILEIQQKFNRLLKLIENQRPGFIEAYGLGLTVEEIHLRFPEIFISSDLLGIYTCISGLNLSSQNPQYLWTDIIPEYSLVSINQVKKEIDKFQDLSKIYPELDDWKSDMIPFLMNESSDYYCVRTLENDHSVWLIVHDNYDFDLKPSFPSTSVFIDFTIDCYQSKIYFLDEDNYSCINYDFLDKIGDKYRGIYNHQYSFL
jgi:uncharacterized protein Usg